MALSIDLRERVVAAVKTEGMSRRAAAICEDHSSFHIRRATCRQASRTRYLCQRAMAGTTDRKRRHQTVGRRLDNR